MGANGVRIRTCVDPLLAYILDRLSGFATKNKKKKNQTFLESAANDRFVGDRFGFCPLSSRTCSSACVYAERDRPANGFARLIFSVCRGRRSRARALWHLIKIYSGLLANAVYLLMTIMRITNRAIKYEREAGRREKSGIVGELDFTNANVSIR